MCPHCGTQRLERNHEDLLAETLKQINSLVQTIGLLAERDLAPTAYYCEFLQLVLTALAAPAGAVWGRTTQGGLYLLAHVNLAPITLGPGHDNSVMHLELLRQALRKPAQIVPPYSLAEAGGNASNPASNPTGYLVLLSPYFRAGEVAGLVEVWQDPDRDPEAFRGFLNFLAAMTQYVSAYAGAR